MAAAWTWRVIESAWRGVLSACTDWREGDGRWRQSGVGVVSCVWPACGYGSGDAAPRGRHAQNVVVVCWSSQGERV
ncbi:hypothetical protein C8R43DRAFT_1019821, partial [Mycena crocata]